jgi:hypothetical protein
VRFLVYQTSGGTPDPNNQLGTLDIVCTGTPQDLSVEVSLTTANDVEVVRASASGFIGPDSSFFSLTGFLASADGSQRVNFGELGSSVNGSSVDFFSIIDFTVGVDTFASISRNLFPTLGEEGLSINVFRGLQMFVFDFRADLFGTGGDLSGPGLFSAANEFGGGTGDLFVACFSGSYENMTVSEASAACDEFAYGEPVPIASGDIAAIQQGYDALRDMHKVVEGLAMAGVAVGQAILASQQPF